ncbi:MAG: radical SAM protein, partial [Chitinophagia bacterium]|nr:radical SAM protein [Chitinophagia bacterium]
GKFAEMIAKQFQIYCKKLNLNHTKLTLNTNDFRRIRNNQLPLF